MQRGTPLPTPPVKVGSTKCAACRVRCNPLAALGAITRMHNKDDPANRSQAAKRIVRGSEELRRACSQRSGLIEPAWFEASARNRAGARAAATFT